MRDPEKPDVAYEDYFPDDDTPPDGYHLYFPTSEKDNTP